MSKNKNAIIRILIAIALLVTAVLMFHFVSVNKWIETGVYLLIYLLIGYDVVWEAISGIGRGQLFDENFLMVLATIGAFGTKQYPEAVSVILLYQIGELFQRYAVGKSRTSISDLLDMRPDTATVLRNGERMEVLPEEVVVGETIIVKPGERIPLDGVVLKGESALDTSALTGESMPRECHCGDTVLSGMIVASGVLEIEVKKEFYDSTMSKILDLVENASGKKAKSEKFITKFSRYYTPIVVALALIMAVIPPLFDGGWSGWITKAMNFLVVSCPCALVISVPMSFFAGIGAASREGVLIKGGNYLELLSKTDTFVFDKTGTLTCGAFSVTRVFPEERREEILNCAAIAEQGSLHPVAKAVLAASGLPKQTGWLLEEKAGRGMIARKDDDVIFVGNTRLMREYGISAAEMKSIGTIVHVARNLQYLGHIEITDTLKSEAPEAICQLKADGSKLVMLTGDNRNTAAMVAEQLGIDDYKAELLPEDKVACVEKLLHEKQVLAFVGDGINDAPVLMRADVGIAMGAIGSDAAVEAADIVLMYDRLSAIAAAKKIAKKTVMIVKQNIIFALGIKLLVLGLTPFGLVSIWLAVFADVGVAVLAILNAMRAGKN